MRLWPTWEQAFEDADRLLSQRYAVNFTESTKCDAALGTLADVVAFLEAFHQAGCRHIGIYLLGNPEEQQTRFGQFEREVKPLLRFTV